MTLEPHKAMKEAHAAWDAANQKLRESERLLATALKQYEEGQGPVPLDIIEKVNAMRMDCGAKFKAMMAALYDCATGQA
jgi:hypothetical protein